MNEQNSLVKAADEHAGSMILSMAFPQSQLFAALLDHCDSLIFFSMFDEGACNALNLGVEFFLLFSHQIRALPSFLFPRLLLLPNFKPV
jgi:hypothetical protein